MPALDEIAADDETFRVLTELVKRLNVADLNCTREGNRLKFGWYEDGVPVGVSAVLLYVSTPDEPRAAQKAAQELAKSVRML
jgi:hypothetical protein